MKKLISLLLVLAMVLALAACSGGTSTPSSSSASTAKTESSSKTESTATETASKEESEAPVDENPLESGEKPELKILSMYQAYNYEDQIGWKLDEEVTGYKTKWFALPAENSDQKLLLDISSGEDYDLLLRISSSQYAQLSKQNALIDLTDLLNQCGGNIQTAVSDLAWQSVTDASGAIYAIPHEDMTASKQEPYGMLRGGIGVRSDMLEELGAELPTNLNDFTAFLEAAKEKYNNTPLTNSNNPFITTIMAGFGMGDAEWYDIDGTYTHRIKHPSMVNYLAYMQDLYQRGLLDNDFPINTGDSAKEKFASGNAIAQPLMFWDIPAMVNALATSNPDCKVEFITDLAVDANSKPTFYIMKGASTFTCVTVNAKNADHAINWLNTLSEPENYKRTYIGEEGVSYEVKDGNYWPIFEGDDTVNFNAYTNSDKLSGICDSTLAFQYWQARARKTPEMAEAYEAMNARVGEYDPRISIEAYGKSDPAVAENIAGLNKAFSDALIKAIAEGSDAATALADMQAEWDANGGLEVEAAMQAFWDANKQLTQ